MAFLLDPPQRITYYFSYEQEIRPLIYADITLIFVVVIL